MHRWPHGTASGDQSSKEIKYGKRNAKFGQKARSKQAESYYEVGWLHQQHELRLVQVEYLQVPKASPEPPMKNHW